MFALSLEANAILFIDPNAGLASPITSQALKTIAWGHGQIPWLAHSINLIELAPSYSPQLTANSPLVRPVQYAPLSLKRNPLTILQGRLDP